LSVTAVDPYTPVLRDEVVLGPATRAGDSMVHHVKDARTGWMYRIGSREHFIMSRMDGHHTVEEIAAAYAEEFGRRLGPEHWAQVFSMLGRRQLLAGAADEATLSSLAESYAARQQEGRSLLRRRIPLLRPDAWCAAAATRLRWAFTWWFLAPALIAVVALEVFVATHAGQLAADMSAGVSLWLAIPAGLAAGWLFIGLHELAHGVTCKHFGGTVPEIGLMWQFPIAAPYCRTDDIVLFNRWARVAVAFAGILVNLLLLLPVLAWWALSAGDSPGRAFAAGLLLFGSAAALANLVPFLRLDGYHMLGHALNSVNLRKETGRYWSLLLRAARPRSRAALRGYRPGDRWAYTLYGLATGAFLATAFAAVGFIWFQRLAAWWGPLAAAVALAGEALLVVTFLAVARRRRASRHPSPVVPGTTEVSDHGR
jgi:putative peptide zinc metalloprotease protein